MGNNKCVDTKPPIIKQQVAMSEGNCRFEIPMMACPDVQPFAHLVPKPTINPPITKKNKPFSVKIFSILKTSLGINPEKLCTPNAAKSALVASAMTISFGLPNKLLAMKPPIKIPTTKNRFQDSFFQSYLKKSTLAGKQAAQICFRLDEMPKALLPKISKIGTVNPIKIPAIDQCQGCRMSSNISLDLFCLGQ